MTKITYSEIWKVRDEIGDLSATTSIGIRNDKLYIYENAMKDLKMTLSALVRHIVVDANLLPEKVLLASPMPDAVEVEFNKETSSKESDKCARSHTVNMSALKLHYLNKVLKKKRCYPSNCSYEMA